MTDYLSDAVKRLKAAKKAADASRPKVCAEPPIGCGKPINKEDFREESGLDVYKVTDLCQQCQDETFGRKQLKAPLSRQTNSETPS